MDAAIVERLAAAGINEVAADLDKHHILERGGFLALVERVTRRIGTAGLLTEKGLAPLVWRGEEAWFVARGLEQRASADEIEALRAFQRDLERALARAS
jgi:hypothetical protein